MTELKKPQPSEMCPPGYHIVKGHERICKSGTTTWVDAHIRKNKGRIKSGLLIENIYFLYWTSKTKFLPLASILGFNQKGGEYDSAVQFWLDYWKSQGIKFPDDFDPLMIKALIALESSFNPNAKSKDPKSTASGLMQVTDQALRVLSGFPNAKEWIEARDHLVHVTKEEKNDPIVNIALGIRLLGHKYSQIPKGYLKNSRGALIGYNQWNKKGEAYADEILSMYEQAKKKK
jgi:hypothetical protein